jgi:hypothetical protein
VFPDLLLTTLALENEFVGVHENRPLVRLTRTVAADPAASALFYNAAG